MFLFEPTATRRLEAQVKTIAARLPGLEGSVIRIGRLPSLPLYDGIHAGALVRERRILFEPDLEHAPDELARIFTHELFHFVWVRLGNPGRLSFEAILDDELRRRARGELGWSAEWRKAALSTEDRVQRSRRWREYCCESFCDSAAWRFCGVPHHAEFTLDAESRRERRRWFERSGIVHRVSV